MPFDGVAFPAAERVNKLDVVIDLLATPDRWHKGALISHDGRRCIRGAVMAVDATGVLEPVILQAISEVAGKRFRRIESFNDHPNTDHEQVLTVLRHARDNLALGQGAPVARSSETRSPRSWRQAAFGWLQRRCE